MDSTNQQQRIWPVFGVAALVVVFGSWLAMSPSPSTAGPRTFEEPFIGPMPEPAVAPLARPVTLTRSGAERAFRVRMSQRRRGAESTVQTSIELVVRESAAERVGDIFTSTRGYSDVQISMSADGEPFGAEVAHEVERLVETARHRIQTRPTGEIVDVQLVSAESAQLRQILGVIEQVVNLAQPRLMREAVRQGEVWSWAVPVTAGGPEGTSASGSIAVDAHVLGQAESGIAVRLSLTGRADLVIATEGEPLGLSPVGSGQGLAVFDAEAGVLRGCAIRWQQTSPRLGVQTIVRVRVESLPST